MIGWSPYDALATFDPGKVETSLVAAGGRLILHPLEPASAAAGYGVPGPAPAPVAAAAPIAFPQPVEPAHTGLFGLSTPAIAAVGVGAVAVLGLVAYKIKKRRKRR